MRKRKHTDHRQENIAWYLGLDLFKRSWIGPRFWDADADAAKKMAEIERVFQESNIIRELLDNWRDGLISEPFVWSVRPVEGDRADADKSPVVEQAEQQLQRWLDWVQQQAIAADPQNSDFKQCDPWADFVLSLGVTGEANLRLWQPKRFENDPDPIHRIHLHVPRVGSVEIERDDDGFVDRISYRYGTARKEVQKMDAAGNVVVTVEGDEVEPIAVATGSRWTVQQVTGQPEITQGMKKKMGAIQHALTMKLRNQEIAGFRERTLINCEYPQDDKGEAIEIERGPGIDTYVYGIQKGDAHSPDYAAGMIHESQPVDIKSFVDSIQIDRTLLYMEAKQGHLLSVTDGGLSGESRIQMRHSFYLHLNGYKKRVESAIANVLNIVLKLLGYESLEVTVDLQITTGKLSAEEQRMVMEQYSKGLLSKATAIGLLGSVADVDSELAAIDEEMQTTQPTLQTDDLPDPLEQL
jgi:hypothetical protein